MQQCSGFVYFSINLVYFSCFQTNSNYNWTFIALNLPYSKGTLRPKKTKTVKYPGTEKRECQGVRKTKVGTPWCTGRFGADF